MPKFQLLPPKPKTKKSSRLLATAFFGFILAYFGVFGLIMAKVTIPNLSSSLSKMQSGQKNLFGNPKQAAADFQVASHQFDQSLASLRNLPVWLKIASPLPPFRWYVRLLKANQALSLAGESASKLALSLPKMPETPKNIPGSTLASNNQNLSTFFKSASQTYFGWSNQHQSDLDNLSLELKTADNELYAVPAWIAFDQNSQLAKLKNQVHSLNTGLVSLRKFTNEFRTTLGLSDQNTHTWAILLQNNAELRPSGGFIGSFATLSGKSGLISDFQFGSNIYKLDKAYNLSTPRQPIPILGTLSTTWGLRDANLGVGFLPAATTQISKYYQEESGVKLDGIIYLDASVLSDLLKLTGLVPLPGNSESKIDSQNLYNTLAREIEQNYFQNPNNVTTNEPKQVLAKLIPVIFEKLQSTSGVGAKFPELMSNIISRKSLQLWSSSQDLNQELSDLLPTDQPPASGNWLKIVNSNLGGMKSSLYVSQNVALTSQPQILKNKLEQTLNISRIHQGPSAWPDADNTNYMEIYLPKDAEIISFPQSDQPKIFLSETDQKTSGVWGKIWKTEVTHTSGYTKVGFWADTKIGKTTNYSLTYTIPLTNQNQNQLTYLKQAGSSNEYFTGWGFKGEVLGNLSLEQ